MERMREILRIMKDTPKGICISPTDDVKKDYITRKSLITDSYLSELGLDKQTYTQRELNENLELIGKHPECIIEKYNTCNWTDSTYETVIDIADYIYEDYIKGGQDGLCFFSFIYNNIIVYIESTDYNDSMISIPYIEFKYVKSQINESDLNTIKKTFNFFNKEMRVLYVE